MPSCPLPPRRLHHLPDDEVEGVEDVAAQVATEAGGNEHGQGREDAQRAEHFGGVRGGDGVQGAASDVGVDAGHD